MKKILSENTRKFTRKIPKWFLIGGGVFLFIIIALIGVKEKGETPNNETLTYIKQKILESGDNKIHGFTYHNDYLWASTRTSPCRVLKINSQTLDYERITLDYGLNDCEDIIYAQGYIWVILYTSPSRIIKVNPTTLDWEITITFKPDEIQSGGSLEYALGYLWAGGSGKIAKINLEKLNYRIYDYSRIVGANQFHALTSGGGYMWGSSPAREESIILRIDPNAPNHYEEVRVPVFITDDMTYIENALYVCSESIPSYLYKINKDLSYSSIEATDSICYGTFSDRKDNLWGAYVGKPGKLLIADLSLTSKRIYELPIGCNDANEIAFDELGNMYVTCWKSPAKIVKIKFSE